MASFGNVMAGLKDLGSSLEGIADKASRTMGVVTDAQRAVESMQSSLTALDKKTDDTTAKQSKFLADIDKTNQAVTALDAIFQAVSDRQNAFSQDIQLQIELVRVGGESLEDFLTLYGDSLILLEDGMHKIRDLFSGADFDVYKDQIQALIQAVNDGSATLGDALDLLKKNASTLAKGLIEAIEAFKRGELSLERLQALLEKTKQDFQGNALGDLADALLDGLLTGDLA